MMVLSRRPARPRRQPARLPPALHATLLGRAPERYGVQLGGIEIGWVEKGRSDRYGRCQWIAVSIDGTTRVCGCKDAALTALKERAVALAGTGEL